MFKVTFFWLEISVEILMFFPLFNELNDAHKLKNYELIKIL